MSNNVFELGVALELDGKLSIDRKDKIFNLFWEANINSNYELNFGVDFITCTFQYDSEDVYQIISQKFFRGKKFNDLYKKLLDATKEHDIKTKSRKKVYTNYWYNGTDNPIWDLAWSEL